MRLAPIAALLAVSTLLLAQQKERLTTTVRRVDMPVVVKTTGTLVASRRSALSFRVAGVVKRVLVNVGDRVKAGQVLAELDDADYRLQVRRAEAQLAAAEAALRMLEAGFRKEEVGQVEALVEAARAQVQMMQKGFRKEQIESARAGVAAAQAAYDLAKKDLERMRRLFEKGAIAKRAYDAAQMQERAAAARLQSAKWQLALLEHGFRQEEVKAALANLKRAQQQFAMMKKGFRKEQIEQARAQVALAKVGLEWAKRQVEYCKLRAPFDGIVVNKMVAPGTYVVTMMRSPVIELLDPTSIEAWLEVSDRFAQVVKVGQRVELEADGGSGKLSGVVAGVSPAMTLPERKFVARVKLDKTEGLKAGMFVRAKIYAGKKSVLAVEKAAVRRDAIGEYLLSVRNGVATKVRVRCEKEFDGLVVVRPLKGARLKEGERVVVAKSIRAGDKVEGR